MESSPPRDSDMKTSFRKPASAVAKRNYRRHSPSDGSSSDVDLEHGHSSSLKYSKEDPAKSHDYREGKKDYQKVLTRDSSRSQYGKGGDLHRYSEHHSSRSSYSQSRHDDHRRRESDHIRSRDYMRRDSYSRDKYESTGHRSRDKEKEPLTLEHEKHKDNEPQRSHRSDSWRKSNFDEAARERSDRHGDGREEKRDQRSSRVHQSGWDKEEFKGNQRESSAGKDQDGQDQSDRGLRNPLDEKSVFEDEGKSPTKKPRLFSSDGGSEFAKDVDGGKQQTQEVNIKANSAQTNVNANEAAVDLNAAKFAAMRAAELVNMNLSGGAGYMSTDQKKKLLWGNKKSTPVEESTRQWDVSTIADPERQEKFNKLMNLRLCWYLWPIVGYEGRGEVFGAKAWERGWEQPNPSRETERAAAESGEAVHSRASEKGRPDCWVRPLGICLNSSYGLVLLHILESCDSRWFMYVGCQPG